MQKWRVNKKELEDTIKEYIEEVKMLTYELEKKQRENSQALLQINKLDKHINIYEEADKKYNEKIVALKEKAAEEEDKMN